MVEFSTWATLTETVFFYTSRIRMSHDLLL
jgi:hypothetical protein